MTTYDSALDDYDSAFVLYDDGGPDGAGTRNNSIRFMCNMGTGMMRIWPLLAFFAGVFYDF